jgi:hypothetical protein
MKPFLAEYLHCSMAGSYWIPCEIHGWDDKSERFKVKYYDFIIEEDEHIWAPYDRVKGYTWPSLSQHFETHGWA